MFPKRLLAIIFAAALAAMGGRVARAQWVQTNGPSGGEIGPIVVSGTNLFAAANGYVFRSFDDGENWIPIWSPVNIGATDSSALCLAVDDSNLFAGTEGGVFRSTNNGTTWSAAGLKGGYVTALVFCGANLFAGTGAGTGPGTGVFRSTDYGVSWSAADTGLPIGGYNGITTFVAIGSNLIAGTDTSGVFRSTNNGASWNYSYWPPSHAAVSFAAVGPNLFGASSNSGGGIFLSTDSGRFWREVDGSGLTNLEVNSLAAYGPYLFAGTYFGGIFRSSNNGANWSASSVGLPISSWVTSFATNGPELFTGTAVNGIFRSTDSGLRWSASDLVASSVTSMASSGPDLFAATGSGFGGGVFHSTNNGTSWNALSSVVTGVYNSYVTSLAINGSNLLPGLMIVVSFVRPITVSPGVQ